MNSPSRFAYFQLSNGTEIHLPRSVLELAAAPGSLPPDSSGIEALAAAILGVSSIDFVGWGLKPPSQVSNELETKMVRATATPLAESYGASEIDRLMEVTSRIHGYCFLSLSYDPVGGTWDVTVTHGTVDCGGSTYGGCETSLTGAVNSTLRAIASALESGILLMKNPRPSPCQIPK